MRTNWEHDLPLAPPPLRLTSANTVELREGGGWMSLFGVPFLLAGGFLGAHVVAVLPKGVPSKGWIVLFALISVVFLVVGALLAFGRRWVTLDIGTGSLLRAIGLLTPMRSECRHLSEFNAVVISFEAGNSDTSDRYPVRLRAMAGNDFVVYSPTTFVEARDNAEFVSRYLRLPLADNTTDHEVIVSAERAGETLQERLRSGSLHTDTTEPPPGMRCQVTQSPGAATIVIPRRKSVAGAKLAMVACTALVLLVVPSLLRFFSRSDIPVGFRWLFVALMVLFFGIAPLVATSVAFGAIGRRTVVTASPAGVVVERGGRWRKHTTVVPARGILDVDCSTVDGILKSVRRSAAFSQAVARGSSGWGAGLKKYIPTKGIIIKSRQGLVTFGDGLAGEELRYLKWVITKALVG